MFFEVFRKLCFSQFFVIFSVIMKSFENGLCIFIIYLLRICPVIWILELSSFHCLLQTRPPRWVVWYFAVLLSSYPYKGHGPLKIFLWTPGVHDPWLGTTGIETKIVLQF